MSERDAVGAFFFFFLNRWFEKENHKEELEVKEASAMKLVKDTNTLRNASGSVWLALCVSDQTGGSAKQT